MSLAETIRPAAAAAQVTACRAYPAVVTSFAANAASVAVAGALLLRHFWAGEDDCGHSAAFADGETDPENFDQTRSAGPEAMRDDVADDWDKVDDALDQSFPASDPSAY
jgi:hypothetical protein